MAAWPHAAKAPQQGSRCPTATQKLEPVGLPQTITAEKLPSQQEAAATPQMKALEKRGQTLKHLPGRRQHLHKLQMLDLNRRRREAELKRNLHREAKINKQKIKEFNPKKVLGSLQRSNSSESQDLVPAEHNQTFNGDCAHYSMSACFVEKTALWRKPTCHM
nr:PREDICTED: uncharacterized protein C14orf105 homolog isoform X2 [Struthio camelus australis]